MSQLMEYAEYLSKEIGPRPAGTEEEQQAALYITERIQKDSGFSAQIEEFTSSSNVEGLRAVPGAIVIVVAILGMIFPMFTIPAFILAAAAAALYTLEAFGHPIVTRALARGASQNVVAKYQPSMDAENAGRRSRKVILVARYDSGKVTPGLVKAIESIKLPVSIGFICVCGIVLAAFFLLLHIFINAGVPGIIINVLTVIALIICLYPILRVILYRVAPYNEGANNNASGAAALIEVARRISRGSVSEADLAEDMLAMGVAVHGLDAARENDLVPEGAQIRYEAERLVPPAELGEYDEEERLLAAKAAIAAMTGQPVERRTYGTVASNLVNSRAHGTDPVFDPNAEAAEAPVASEFAEERPQAVEEAAPMPAPAQEETRVVEEAMAEPTVSTAPPMKEEQPSEADGFKNAPSWFVAAQQNAKKSESETGPVQRSRYAEAIEAAEREAAEREREREETERLKREAELKVREREARAAIEQSIQASRTAEQSPVDEQAPLVEQPPAKADEAKPAAEAAPSDQAAPVFVPYSEAHSEADVKPAPVPVPVGDAPADDEFAASLGSTMPFNLQELREGGEGEAADGSLGDDQKGGRLADLPALDTPAAEKEPSVPETTNPSRSGMFRKLRTDVPSMSGVIRMQEAGEDVSQKPVQHYGEPVAAPVPAAAPTAVIEARPDQVDYDMNPAEIADYAQQDRRDDRDYRDDRYDRDYRDYRDYRDDRSHRDERDTRREYDEYDQRYEEDRDVQYEPSSQVEMPKSRAGGFLNRFRRSNREDLEETPQEWLDVDEDFDARTVGRERGGWESFRDDAHDDAERDDRRWNGGAYSRVRLGRVDTRSGEDTDADEPGEIIDVDEDRQIADEIEQIYHFRNPLYNTELWFVALGSEGDAHDGAKAFLAEHADDLRGAMLIEVESLGVGDLCVASAEGRIKTIVASSRVKRYTKTATAATGIAPGSVDLRGSDSATSIFQAAGYQAMHMLGVEDGAPALKGSADDVFENIDELVFDDNVNYLMELLKK